jgi:hypothetical protein
MSLDGFWAADKSAAPILSAELVKIFTIRYFAFVTTDTMIRLPVPAALVRGMPALARATLVAAKETMN